MKIQHPFNWLPESLFIRAFILLFVLTFVLLMCLNLIDAPLKTTVAPNGIISYELAGELSVAQEMIRSWGAVGQIYAGLSLGFDFLFLVSYSLFIALGCIIVTRRLSQPGQFLFKFGALLAWAQFGAAILDAIENYALIRILLGSQNEILPVVAYWCALPKFVIVVIGMGYICFGFIFLVFSKMFKKTS
ncbi:hypothetical protein H8E88_17255 [candidate division KSB1 bacterium]|nr:hypothetical protein [candidate division KSB1 bacterium]MBL7095857.1 hypothetical protein [candidate division KSB1 bacterium]